MFLELSQNTYEKMKELLLAMNVEYEASDCTLEGDSVRMVHLEISNELSAKQVQILNEKLDEIELRNKEFFENEKERKEEAYLKDKDGDGIPDIWEENGEIKEVRHRKWDDSMHTPSQEALGYITGANMEEEVTYEKST